MPRAVTLESTNPKNIGTVLQGGGDSKCKGPEVRKNLIMFKEEKRPCGAGAR